MRLNTSFKYRSVPLTHFFTSTWNWGIETLLSQVVKHILWVWVCLFNFTSQIIMVQVPAPYLLNFFVNFEIIHSNNVHSFSFILPKQVDSATYRGSSGCVLREKSFQASPRWGQWWSPDSAPVSLWPRVSLHLRLAAVWTLCHTDPAPPHATLHHWEDGGVVSGCSLHLPGCRKLPADPE